MKHYNIPIFINHYGCPNSCVFCNQKKINGVETDVTADDVKNIIETHLKTLPKESTKEVAFFGGTFTGISLKLQVEYLEVVYPYIKNGLINGIRLSTRPDYINDEILSTIKKYGVKLIELGIQSLDSQVLKKSERYYSYDTVKNACDLIHKYDIDLGVQMMIGLPGSSFESDLDTAKQLADFHPKVARIYPTLVINDTKLEKMYKNDEYLPLDIENAIKISKKIYAFFQNSGINVIRIGLQPSDDLRKDGVVIGGPFHPAFRDLVEGEMFYDFFLKLLSKEKKLKILSNQKNISKVIGNKKRNKNRLKDKIDVFCDNSIPYDSIQINSVMYKITNIYLEQLS